MKRVLAAGLMLSLTTSCAAPAPVPIVSSGCAWVRQIDVPDAERPIVIRQAPLTAQQIGDHNAAVRAACR